VSMLAVWTMEKVGAQCRCTTGSKLPEHPELVGVRPFSPQPLYSHPGNRMRETAASGSVGGAFGGIRCVTESLTSLIGRYDTAETDIIATETRPVASPIRREHFCGARCSP
jgi:hypothetical protein